MTEGVMSEGLWLWLTLLAIGSTTIMTRGSFILAGVTAILAVVLALLLMGLARLFGSRT